MSRTPMDRRLRGSDSWAEGGSVRRAVGSGQSGQSPGVARCGGSEGCSVAFGLLRGTLEVDDGKMSPAVQELDLHREPHAGLALHQGHRLGAAGGPRPTGARLEARLMVCRTPLVVNFVGRPVIEGHVRTMAVVPSGEELEFAEERSALHGHHRQPGDALLEREDQPLDERDAAVLADGVMLQTELDNPPRAVSMVPGRRKSP